MRASEPRRPSPVPRVVAAAAVLAGLWFARSRLVGGGGPARAPSRAPDGAAYLRDVGPMLRRAGCATTSCHGGAASPHMAPALSDAADAVREFHDMRARAGVLYERAIGRGHPASLREGSCEAAMLRDWAAGRAVRRCQRDAAAR